MSEGTNLSSPPNRLGVFAAVPTSCRFARDPLIRTHTSPSALEDVSAAHVGRVLRHRNIVLQRRRSWCISTDPQFAEKAADVVGLYLRPPENAVVLSVDEKPSIQALNARRAGFDGPTARRSRDSHTATSVTARRPSLRRSTS